MEVTPGKHTLGMEFFKESTGEYGELPAIARRTVGGRQRIDLNIFPSFVHADEATLYANALQFQ